MERHVIDDYISLMKSYYEQKDKIPEGQLVEISYEKFVVNPLDQVRQVYAKLDLPGFEEAKLGMQQHLDRQAGYVTNPYTIDKAIIQRVKKHWGFTIKRWGYKPPK